MSERTLTVTLLGCPGTEEKLRDTLKARFWKEILNAFGDDLGALAAHDAWLAAKSKYLPDLPPAGTEKDDFDRWAKAVDAATDFAFKECPGLDPGDDCFCVDVEQVE